MEGWNASRGSKEKGRNKEGGNYEGTRAKEG